MLGVEVMDVHKHLPVDPTLSRRERPPEPSSRVVRGARLLPGTKRPDVLYRREPPDKTHTERLLGVRKPDEPRKRPVTPTQPQHDPRTAAVHPDPTILVLGTADWNARIATNQHYVVRELARDYEVHFVESLGLRRVRFDIRDLGRMATRLQNSLLGHSATTYRQIPARAKVISALVVPLHRKATFLPNRLLLERAVSEWRHTSKPKVLWTFTPVTYQLEQYADFTLYHCVDILPAFPGIDATAVTAGEGNLAEHAHLAIATSERVTDHLRDFGFAEIMTLRNVADVEVFAAASQPAVKRRPAALFAGNLSPHKLDFELLRALAIALQGKGDLVLAGPIAAGGGNFDRELDELKGLGATYLGVLQLDQLAEVASTCTVGLVPYALNRYTTGVSPLKCYEYLSAGLKVVGTAIPDLIRAADSSDFVMVRNTPENFVTAVLDNITPASDDTIQARTKHARAFGWGSRGDLLRSIVARIGCLPPDGMREPTEAAGGTSDS